jgi:transposase-like protein
MAKSVLSEAHFQDEKAAFAYVESHLWPDGPYCPFCGATEEHVGRLNGKTTRLGLHKCYACAKPFTVRIGTIFESSHLKLHLWLQVIHLMCASKKGIATRQIQRMLQCSMKTAWFVGHRVRETMKPAITGPLGGEGITLEADETFFGRKAGTKIWKKPSTKMAVVSLVERNGNVRSFHVPNVQGETLRTVLEKHASASSDFMTDDAGAYNRVGWNFASHGIVKHTLGEYVGGDIHTNTVEGFFSIMKRGVYGVYQHVSEAHLKRYLAEFDFRYCSALGIEDEARASLALESAKGKRLTYETARS